MRAVRLLAMLVLYYAVLALVVWLLLTRFPELKDKLPIGSAQHSDTTATIARLLVTARTTGVMADMIHLSADVPG